MSEDFINVPPSDDTPRELGELWRLMKGARLATHIDGCFGRRRRLPIAIGDSVVRPIHRVDPFSVCFVTFWADRMWKQVVSVSDFYAHPDLYDALLPVDAHVPFYVDLARQQAGAVLEPACGTGQLTAPVAVLAARHSAAFSWNEFAGSANVTGR